MNIRLDPSIVPMLKEYCETEGLKNISAGVHRLLVLGLNQPKKPQQAIAQPAAQQLQPQAQPAPMATLPTPKTFAGFGGGLKI